MKNNCADRAQAEKFFETLPKEILDFELKKNFAEVEDKFFYCAYEDEKNHRSAAFYFHDETAEYKVRVKIGLNEFCLTKFFTSDFEKFCGLIQANLADTIKNLSAEENLNPLLQEKNFAAWEYGKNLPKNLEGFELFISPKNPVQFTNGSTIIINYSDFELLGDLTIYYNVYGDNFSGESRIKNVPHVIYSFDAENLKDLEIKLEENLSAELAAIKNSV